jgi:group I intron endonuclease
MQAVHQKAAYNKTMSSALVKWSKPGIIYVARNRVNGKLYVGQTIKSLVRRRCDHVNCADHGSELAFHSAIRKHGKTSFEFTIVQRCHGRTLLNEAERWWIKQLRSMVPNGYNLTDGGEASIPSEQTRRKMSEATRRRMTPDGMKALGEKGHAALRGSRWTPERRANHKVNVSPEVLKRRMEGRLANPYVASEEDKRKISEGKRGKKVSAEGRANISAAHMGIHKGYVHSEESKRNMSEGKRRWWAKRKSANKSQISLDFGHGRREL